MNNYDGAINVNDFEKQPLFNMLSVEEVEQIAITSACHYLNVPSVDDYHMDINILTNCIYPENSMYVVHFYTTSPDRDVLQIDIQCTSGLVIRIDYAKEVLGDLLVQDMRDL